MHGSMDLRIYGSAPGAAARAAAGAGSLLLVLLLLLLLYVPYHVDIGGALPLY